MASAYCKRWPIISKVVIQNQTHGRVELENECSAGIKYSTNRVDGDECRCCAEVVSSRHFETSMVLATTLETGW